MKMKILLQKLNQGTGFFRSAIRVCGFVLIMSLTALVLPANSQVKDFPNKPITIVVPWPAGAGTDLGPRALAPALSKMLGVSVNVVNKPGGSGVIGTLEVVKSLPDGYTLLAEIGGTSSIQSAWFQDLPYKLEERTYIARTICSPQTLIVPGSSPWKAVEELVSAIRTNPSDFSFGLAGGAGAPDVCIAQFRAAMATKGVDISKTRMVNYKGAGEALLAVAGGHVQVGFASPSGIISLISAGKLRALAVSSAGRFKDWPDVPTTAEAGFPSVSLVFWVGLSGPPGLPSNVVKILENAVRESLSTPDVTAKLDKMGFEPFYESGDKYWKFILDEREAIKALKLK
jgi:tripartite-type tricarboxylate transporter receptor subunit TctC